MAGLSCAAQIEAAGLDPVLYDKGRGPGGRMATRRIEVPGIGAVRFDHGAQFFTARDPRFARKVADWACAGIVARWPEAGEEAWVGHPAMNAPIAAEATRWPVHFGCQIHAIEQRGDGWWLHAGAGVHGPHDAVVVAIPAEQAALLIGLHDMMMVRHLVAAPSRPCWTLMATYDAPLPIDRAIIRDAAPIGWAARNNAKPGRAATECWVVQADPSWSSAWLEREADVVAGELVAALHAHCAAAARDPVHAVAHRWRHAMPRRGQGQVLWNPVLGLGACGDWLEGPRVELAWLAGYKLGAAISATLAPSARTASSPVSRT